MLSQIRPALRLFVALSAITGGIYPAVVTALARTMFPRQSTGSLLTRDGLVVGSEWIGQRFDDPRWFWSRPSSTTPAFNGAASSGSNLGPTNPALRDAVAARVAVLLAADPDQREPIPIDLVTASGSGLDPHLSPAAARWQVSRVARARALDPARVSELVDRHLEGRDLGILGEPRVNVLRLNLELDALE